MACSSSSSSSSSSNRDPQEDTCCCGCCLFPEVPLCEETVWRAAVVVAVASVAAEGFPWRTPAAVAVVYSLRCHYVRRQCGVQQ